MGKNTTITATDGINMKDKNGQQPKTVHQETFEKFNINPEQVYDGTSLKPLDKAWYPEIIQQSVIFIESPVPDSVNANVKARIVTMGFNSKDDADKFMEQFHSSLFKSVNHVIREKGENPKQYDRGLVLSDEINGSDKGATVIISY